MDGLSQMRLDPLACWNLCHVRHSSMFHASKLKVGKLYMPWYCERNADVCTHSPGPRETPPLLWQPATLAKPALFLKVRKMSCLQPAHDLSPRLYNASRGFPQFPTIVSTLMLTIYLDTHPRVGIRSAPEMGAFFSA